MSHPGVSPPRWQRLRYTLWSPIYDLVVRPLQQARQRSIAVLALRPGDRVLVPGVGTGEDLRLMPAGVSVVGADLTPAMLGRARAKGVATPLCVMDSRRLAFADASFDAVVLHLILAVMDEPGRGLREAARVLRPGGRIAVFDKFLADAARPSPLRRLANAITSTLFSDINRRLGDMIADSGAGLEIVHDEAVLFRGAYRIVLLRAADHIKVHTR